MATQPPANLPLFYKNLVPLQTGPHSNYRQQPTDKAPFFGETHAVPLTIDEFVMAQRFYPIVFSIGENSVPLALFGLNEGVNMFVEADGKLRGEFYVPAYVRRYPFMLARLAPGSQELSLCFDPESGLVGEGGDGPALFDGDKPSETTNGILKFCEEFELAAQRTGAFVKELEDMDLLMDGEVSIQIQEQQQPYVYRGFRMINEEKFRALGAEELHKIHQNGILPLITAHLFSLSQMPTLFGKQMSEGRVPQQALSTGNL
jgi:hypothetical protein